MLRAQSECAEALYCTEYFSPATMGSGPISAMRWPWAGLHFASSIVINHTLPKDSITVPCGPSSTRAAARVEYPSRCQNTCDLVSWPTGSSAMTQHPTSWVRSLAGLHTPPGVVTPCADSCLVSSDSRPKKSIPMSRPCLSIDPGPKGISFYYRHIAPGSPADKRSGPTGR